MSKLFLFVADNCSIRSKKRKELILLYLCRDSRCHSIYVVLQIGEMRRWEGGTQDVPLDDSDRVSHFWAPTVRKPLPASPVDSAARPDTIPHMSERVETR